MKNIVFSVLALLISATLDAPLAQANDCYCKLSESSDVDSATAWLYMDFGRSYRAIETFRTLRYSGDASRQAMRQCRRAIRNEPMCN